MSSRHRTRTEIRKRGFFGWLFLLMFLGFNALMVVWLISYWGLVGEASPRSEAEQAGHLIGSAVGTSMIVFFWTAGAMILGIFALLTKARRVVIEEHFPDEDRTDPFRDLPSGTAQRKERREPTF